MTTGFQLAQKQAEAYESFTHVFMDGSARLLTEAASLTDGSIVLDLACGTGLVAGHAAPPVAPSGRVVGADINGAMLAVARRRTGGGTEFVEAPCDALPFEDATFTHVLCQQGFQFFPRPKNAMEEGRRVLRPGGVLLATVWATPGRNPYIENQLDLLRSFDASLAESAQQAAPPNADEFLRTNALAAGFADVETTLLEHTAEIDGLREWFLAQTGATPWGPVLATMSDADREDLVAKMLTRMAPYESPTGEHRIPFCSYLLTAAGG